LATLIATATPTPTLAGLFLSALTALPSAFASASVLELALIVNLPPDIITIPVGIYASMLELTIFTAKAPATFTPPSLVSAFWGVFSGILPSSPSLAFFSIPFSSLVLFRNPNSLLIFSSIPLVSAFPSEPPSSSSSFSSSPPLVPALAVVLEPLAPSALKLTLPSALILRLVVAKVLSVTTLMTRAIPIPTLLPAATPLASPLTWFMFLALTVTSPPAFNASLEIPRYASTLLMDTFSATAPFIEVAEVEPAPDSALASVWLSSSAPKITSLMAPLRAIPSAI
jgi:hypothetical protein